MSEQLSGNGKYLVKYMPQAVNALADRLIEKLEERLLYGEKPQTNADRIRGMSDEELADEYIRIYHKLGCYTDSWAWLRKWLKSPVDKEAQDG